MEYHQEIQPGSRNRIVALLKTQCRFVRSRSAAPTEALRTQIKQPLLLTETVEKFDVLATVAGGGVSGQAGAVKLGIARALVEYNAELRKRLKKSGLLTRDARIKERKKYGMAGARKRFQFSKR